MAHALQGAKYVADDATQDTCDGLAAKDPLEGERARSDNHECDREHVQGIQTKEFLKQLRIPTDEKSDQHQRNNCRSQSAHRNHQQGLLVQEGQRQSRRGRGQGRWLRGYLGDYHGVVLALGRLRHQICRLDFDRLGKARYRRQPKRLTVSSRPKVCTAVLTSRPTSPGRGTPAGT